MAKITMLGGKRRVIRMVAVGWVLVAVVLAGWLGDSAVAARAKYGNFDASFGDAGRATLDLGDSDEKANSLLLQPDGKIVLAGISFQDKSSRFRFTLVRYNADGSLDTDFGAGGVVQAPISESESDISANAFAAALQLDGKIVLVGTAFQPGGAATQVAVARYNPDGSLDDGFGNSGWVLTTIETGSDEHAATIAQAVAVAPDGKIVVAAQAPGRIAVLRYNANGTPDASFGDGGITTPDLGADEAPVAVLLQADGKIVVAGTLGWGAVDFLLARYESDGTLDADFGQGGKVVTDFIGGDDWAAGLALGPDSKIIVAGYVDTSYVADCGARCGPRIALAQYNPDGSPDRDFGTAGQVVYGLGSDQPLKVYDLARRSDGKLLVAGSKMNNAFALALFNEDGSPDKSFGAAGIVLGPFAGSYAAAYAVGIAPDGKIVAVGQATSSDDSYVDWDWALARFDAPPLDAESECPLEPPAIRLPMSLWQYACRQAAAQ